MIRPPNHGGRPEDALERDEFWQAFRASHQGPPRRRADVFTPREIDAMASEDVCKQLETTESNLEPAPPRASGIDALCERGKI